jgi:hypothetical protein
VKPAKVSVYVQLTSVGDPDASDFVQFPLGQVAAAKKAAFDGAPGPESAGTVSRPFLGSSWPVVLGADWTVDFTGTSLPPLLVQSTVAE